MALLAACLPFPSFNFAFYHCAVGKYSFLKNVGFILRNLRLCPFSSWSFLALGELADSVT